MQPGLRRWLLVVEGLVLLLAVVLAGPATAGPTV
jgi:hypothetical protein